MTTATIAIPYYASDLPVLLPTEDEIEAASDIAPVYLARRVVQVNTHFVVKFGAGVELAEGVNMVFVRENTHVPVPRVYALYSQDGKNYMIMQRVEGQTLLKLWPQLDFTEKEQISTTLRTYFDEVRTLTPPHYYGSLGEQRLLDGMFWTDEPNVKINGPFTSENDLIEGLAQRPVHDGGSKYKTDFYRQYLPHVLKGHSPTFTHGDLQKKNVMAHKLSGETASPQGSAQWQITILDWEAAGWYPSYWEYSLAVWALQWDDDWSLWVGRILQPYPAQSAAIKLLRLEIW